MTRLLAILGAIFCIGMIFPMAAGEPARGAIDLQIVVIQIVIEVITSMSLLFYCGFAALHSVSHVQDPGERVGWVILTILFNVLGSLVYYLTKYQEFRSHGMGRLIRPGKGSGHSFFRATPSDLRKPNNSHQIDLDKPPGSDDFP